jgi:hypothetical protein
MRCPAQLIDDLGARLPGFRAGDAARRRDDDQQLHVALGEPVGEQLCAAFDDRVRMPAAAIARAAKATIRRGATLTSGRSVEHAASFRSVRGHDTA